MCHKYVMFIYINTAKKLLAWKWFLTMIFSRSGKVTPVTIATAGLFIPKSKLARKNLWSSTALERQNGPISQFIEKTRAWHWYIGTLLMILHITWLAI